MVSGRHLHLNLTLAIGVGFCYVEHVDSILERGFDDVL